MKRGLPRSYDNIVLTTGNTPKVALSNITKHLLFSNKVHFGQLLSGSYFRKCVMSSRMMEESLPGSNCSSNALPKLSFLPVQLKGHARVSCAHITRGSNS